MSEILAITGGDAVQKQLQAIGRQAPFALATALNGVANAAQKGIRENMADKFAFRRRNFVESTIYRNKATDFATKSKFSATVRVHPERDVLAKHEAGGAKTPRSGNSIAIPSAAVRRNKADVIPRGQRPAALLGKKGVFRLGDVIYQSTGRGKRKRRTALYLLRRSVRIAPRLEFVKTAERTIAAQWVPIATAAIEKALQTAR